MSVATIRQAILDGWTLDAETRLGVGGTLPYEENGQLDVLAHYIAKQIAGAAAGSPEHAVKTGTQAITSAATITWDSIDFDSADVTYSSDEFVVVTAGSYRIDMTCRRTVGTSTSMEVWMTDDTAAQGTDVETPATRAGAQGQNNTATMQIHALLTLDAGDTIRFRAERTVGTNTCDLLTARCTIQRFA